MDDMLFKQYPYFNRKNIHIPNGDADDMNAEASKYNDVLEQQGQRDIQILGIGENGHIGFNEPGTPFDSVTHIVDLTESTIKANSRYFKTKMMFQSKPFRWDLLIFFKPNVSFYSHLVKRNVLLLHIY